MANKDAVFIGRAKPIRRYAPMVHEFLIFKDPEDDIRIPYIND